MHSEKLLILFTNCPDLTDYQFTFHKNSHIEFNFFSFLIFSYLSSFIFLFLFFFFFFLFFNFSFPTSLHHTLSYTLPPTILLYFVFPLPLFPSLSLCLFYILLLWVFLHSLFFLFIFFFFICPCIFFRRKI